MGEDVVEKVRRKGERRKKKKKKKGIQIPEIIGKILFHFY